MHQLTQQHFHAMLQRQAKLNGVAYSQGSNELNFAVTPSVEQTMEALIQEQADFLQAINIVGVRDLKGQKIRLGAGNTLAGRTDTTTADRATQDPSALSEGDYECRQTDFDSHLTYSRMDQWSSQSNFQTLWQMAVIEQIARDRMMIGFNGTSAAANTDRAANPLLQDVNIGWLENIRQYSGGSQHEANIVLGGSNEYKNIDALVMAMVSDMLEPWYSMDTGLVAICGRDVLSDKYVGLVNSSDNDKPTEQVAIPTMLSTKRIGNIPTIQVPFFPAKSVLVTKLDMLSIYYQQGSRRRTIENNAKRSRVEDYQSVNEDYVVEDFGCTAFIENVTEAAA